MSPKTLKRKLEQVANEAGDVKASASRKKVRRKLDLDTGGVFIKELSSRMHVHY